MFDYRVQSLVVGAGVVGLACGARLASTGREVLVVERNRGIGEEVSSRNSEVIHAGIYYPPGSLKAKLCVKGRQQLYQYCQQHGVQTRRTGKLIVATHEGNMVDMEQLVQRGKLNGVQDLEWLTAHEARTLEPALSCFGAVHSPSTGIVDSHGLMLSLQSELERMHGVISFASTVKAIECTGDGLVVKVNCADEIVSIKADELINCAGLSAVRLARCSKGIDSNCLPQAHFSKGNYFQLKGPTPFSRLIYPPPVPGGLGVHLVLDLAGRGRFGPDVEFIADIDGALEVDPSRANSFYQSIREYWPGLKDGALLPDYAGIRPKIAAKGSHDTDFLILSEADHSVRGLVHCLGIESPGLTSSLAIADEVVSRLDLPRAGI